MHRPVFLISLWDMKILILPILFLFQADPVSQEIEAIVSKSGLGSAQLGIYIAESRTGRVLFEKDSQKERILASNTKILTCAAALDRLGPEFLFETALYIDREGAEATLYVSGNGDPNLSARVFDGDPTKLFRKWASELRRKGIRKIRGVVLCNRGFDQETRPPSWKKHPQWHWYAAPYGTFSLNENCVDLLVGPGRPGKSAAITSIPQTAYITLRNQTKTIQGKTSNPWGFDRKDNQNIIRAWGKISTLMKPKTYWVSIHDPYRFFGTVLLETMEAEGLSVSHSIQITQEVVAKRHTFLDRHTSTLGKSLKICLTVSQNFYAEMILRTLGKEAEGFGSRENGIKAVDSFLQKAGVRQYEQTDGSGLSRGNTMSARDIGQIFEYMGDHPHSKTFRNSLAVNGGSSGTLRKRMTSAPYKGRIQAKTGHISGVSNLSGYLTATDGTSYVFSFLMNHWKKGSPHTLQHKLCLYLVDYRKNR